MPDLTPYDDLVRFMKIIDLTSIDGEGRSFLLFLKEYPDIKWREEEKIRRKAQDEYEVSLKKMEALGMVSIEDGDGYDGGYSPDLRYRFAVPKEFVRSILNLEMTVHDLMIKIRHHENEYEHHMNPWIES